MLHVEQNDKTVTVVFITRDMLKAETYLHDAEFGFGGKSK